MGWKFKFFTFLAILYALVETSESANILGVFTSSSPSHLIIHMSYIKALLERGHNVTVLTTQPLKDKNLPITHFLIPQSEATLKRIEESKAQITKKGGILQTIKISLEGLMDLGPQQAEPIKDQRFQDFLHNPDNKFDVVIIGYFFNSFQIGLGAHFKCPVIVSWMTAPFNLVNNMIGNPPEISYIPASPMFAAPDMTKFTGRLANFVIGMLNNLFAYFIEGLMDQVYTELFPASEYPSYQEARKKISLLLMNYHYTDGMIHPTVPGAIMCGGIQIKDKPNSLPKNLQKIFNSSSEHGVIYLSFGSNIKSKDMNPELFNILIKTLSGLKQKVLWKWDAPEKPSNASNIYFEKWLPQDDLLAEPNLKLFITHAGKGSVTESQYHGVPMITIPMVADQIANAGQVAKDVFGIKVDQNTVTVESLTADIKEVLNNPKYTTNVKKFSQLYRDRPMTAKSTAVFWIEYVIRHKGAYHMQSPAIHLSAVQYASLDVIGFLILVAYLVYKSITIPSKFILSKLLSKKQKVKVQ